MCYAVCIEKQNVAYLTNSRDTAISTNSISCIITDMRR